MNIARENTYSTTEKRLRAWSGNALEFASKRVKTEVSQSHATFHAKSHCAQPDTTVSGTNHGNLQVLTHCQRKEYYHPPRGIVKSSYPASNRLYSPTMPYLPSPRGIPEPINTAFSFGRMPPPRQGTDHEALSRSEGLGREASSPVEKGGMFRAKSIDQFASHRDHQPYRHPTDNVTERFTEPTGPKGLLEMAGKRCSTDARSMATPMIDRRPVSNGLSLLGSSASERNTTESTVQVIKPLNQSHQDMSPRPPFQGPNSSLEHQAYGPLGSYLVRLEDLLLEALTEMQTLKKAMRMPPESPDT